MRNYEKPEVKVLEMGSEDIIQTSGGGLNNGGQGGTIGGESGDSGIFSLRNTTGVPNLYK